MELLGEVTAVRESRQERGTWELLPACAALNCPGTLKRWRELLAEPTGGQRMYQTPEWLGHVARHCAAGERVGLAVARAADGAVLGLAPFHVSRDSLRFHTAGRTLLRFPLLKLSVLGGQPLLPESGALYDGLFAALHESFPECGVGLGAVTSGGFLWHYLRRSSALRGMYLSHLAAGVRTYYSMSLPSRYSDYLAGMRGKKRYNLGRQARLLREYGRGTLELERVDSEAEVPGFQSAVADLRRAAGLATADSDGGGDAAERRWLTDLARLGFLRSYLLRCGDRPAAAIIGYRHGDVCLVDCTLYSQAFARFSPGSVLLHLAVEDLIDRGGVRLIDFGFGDPLYNSSALTRREAASVLLLREGFANRVRSAAHAGFQTSARCLRRAAVGLGLWRGRAR